MTGLLLSMVLACSYERYQKHDWTMMSLIIWYALRVYMTEDQKAYLKRKTRAERDQYLKENGCEGVVHPRMQSLGPLLQIQ